MTNRDKCYCYKIKDGESDDCYVDFRDITTMNEWLSEEHTLKELLDIIKTGPLGINIVVKDYKTTEVIVSGREYYIDTEYLNDYDVITTSTWDEKYFEYSMDFTIIVKEKEFNE